MSDKEYVYGLHAVQAMLERAPKRVRQLKVQRGRLDARMQALLELAESEALDIERVMPDELDRLADGGVHQGVVAAVTPSQLWSEEMLGHLLDKEEGVPLLLVLDGVTDPHNLGACLRSAAAAGATAVVIPKDKAVQINATVRKTSAGAADTIPVVRVTNLARTLRELQKQGVWIHGLAGDATTPIYKADLIGNVALVLGGEGDGMRRLTRETCDHLVNIPMPGGFESLNVSVATGIALFEAVRQRGASAA